MAKTGDYARKQDGPPERKPAKKKYLGYADMIFVEYVLDTAQTLQLKAWTNDPDYLWARLNAYVSDGYKFSFSLDSANNAFMCTALVTLSHRESKWHGYCMTQRGSEPLKAFKRTIYIIDVVCDGDLELLTATRVNREIDD